MRLKEHTYYLEMTRPEMLRPARVAGADLELIRVETPSPELNRRFYTAVGAGWRWVDRLDWTRERWLEYLTRPQLETWVASFPGAPAAADDIQDFSRIGRAAGGTPAGYCELEGEPGGSVEIVYLGLLPQFTGRGLGGCLVTLAARRAWAKGARRVWLHTSSFDHPAALPNYLARGFRLFKQEVSFKEFLDGPPGAAVEDTMS
jgi:ribosomal protein S18 acetylase RimI-like enzyme